MKNFLKKSLPLALFIIAVIFIVQIVLALLLVLIFNKNTTNAVIVTVYSALVYLISVFAIIYLPKKISPKIKLKVSREDLGLQNMLTWTDIGLSVVGFIVYIAVAAIFTSIFTILPWFNANETQDLGYSQMLFGLDRIVAMIALVVIAPIAEEIIFRGFLYNNAKASFIDKKSHNRKQKEWPAIIAASILTSVVFGLMHGQWNVGVNVFAMSLVLCAMREITGTIYAGILMHIIKNAVAFYLVYITGYGNL